MGRQAASGLGGYGQCLWFLIPPSKPRVPWRDPESPSLIPVWFLSLCAYEWSPSRHFSWFQTSELPISLFPVSLIKSYSRVWAEFENSIPQVHPHIVLSLIQMLTVNFHPFPRGLSITFVSLTREQGLQAYTFTRGRTSRTNYLFNYLSVLKSFIALCNGT